MRGKVNTTAKEPEAKTPKPEAEDKCHHYWIIESPHGPTSKGVCQFCGAVKEFYNSPPEFWFGKRHPEGFEPPDSTPGEADTKKGGADITPESSADT